MCMCVLGLNFGAAYTIMCENGESVDESRRLKMVVKGAARVGDVTLQLF